MYGGVNTYAHLSVAFTKPQRQNCKLASVLKPYQKTGFYFT